MKQQTEGLPQHKGRKGHVKGQTWFTEWMSCAVPRPLREAADRSAARAGINRSEWLREAIHLRLELDACEGHDTGLPDQDRAGAPREWNGAAQ